MAAGQAVIYVQVGESDRAWCERCNTSAILTFPLTTICDRGVTKIGQISACTRCDPGIAVHGEVVPWEFDDDE